ncbi:MAG: thioredoxin domain-containing protein [Pseudomonadota bacterium]
MSHNRLANEPSPYLVQHKDNPVHWYPWGEEAFEEAKASGKPVLLSIGYAACHWCHVMAHESFEDQSTADVMNELFVNIKLDREERPDIDKIYMEALHHLGEQGGWPLTMFLNAERQPFWGGTYFPKTPQFGRPSFTQVLHQIANIYATAQDKVESNCTALSEALKRTRHPAPPERAAISMALIDEAARQVQPAIDYRHGGLQGAPKFPQFSILQLLWRHHIRTGDETSRNAVLITLKNICQGGIYDHLRGGMARYSVDTRWLAPHFEKMLYDNAQLLDILIPVWQATKEDLFRIRIEETIDWVATEMIAEHSAFAASLDADSEGVEGKFYVWSRNEIENVLGSNAARFCNIYDVTEAGNWEHTNILNRLDSLNLLDEETEQNLAKSRAALLSKRSERIRPGFDDKILTDWNGLMIASIAACGHVFERRDWIALASRAYTGVRDTLCSHDHFLQSHRNGQTHYHATADGYANMIRAALKLHECTGDGTYLEDGISWAGQMSTYFWDDADGGFFYTSTRATDLIRRTRFAGDDATPNANATMLGNLAKLYQLTGDDAFRKKGLETLEGFTPGVAASAVAHSGFLNGAEDFIEPLQAVIIEGDGSKGQHALVRALLSRCLPTLTINTYADTRDLPQSHPAAGKTATGGSTLYLCRGQSCSLPISDPEKVTEALDRF